MHVSIRTPIAALAALFSWTLLSGAGVSWSPIPREELALTEPMSSDVDLGVEVLFRESVVDESDFEASITKTHVRFKVFDERGVERIKQIDVRFNAEDSRVQAIGARVIKPDGTIIDVDRKSFFTREVVRNRYYRYKVVSFSPPALEPGVIVEYKVVFQGEPKYFGFFAMQDEYPTRIVRYRVRPPVVARLQILTLYHRCPSLQAERDKGFFTYTLEMVPAAKDEPYAPPDEQVRMWMIYYYTYEVRTPEKFWTEIGQDLHKDYDKPTRPRPDIEKASAEIIAGAESDREKLQRIDTFCRTQIRNTYSDISGFTPDEIAKLKPNKTPSDTLMRKYGTASDLRLLFIALARAAGFDARLARSADRSGINFNPNMVVGYSVPDWIVAVKLEGSWWFTQPSISYLPFGALHWTDEGQVAIVADPKAVSVATTQISPADTTHRKRTAKLTLGEDGTLEGDVTIELTGHLAVGKKEELDGETPARREEIVREEVTERLPAAKVTAITFDNLTAPTGSMTIRYHLQIPGYASATSQRLFVQPSIFEVGASAVFTAEERNYSIYFPYQSVESDRVEIRLPDGFALENAHSPEALDPSEALIYDPKIAYRKSDHTVIYTRIFALKLRTVDAAQYGLLRAIFSHIHEKDAHAVGIRREVEPTVESPAPTAEGAAAAN